MQGSDATSCFNCCLEDCNIDSPELSLPQSTEEFINVLQDEHAATIPTKNVPMIFYTLDDMENDISTSILCTHDQQLEFSEKQPPRRPPPRPQFQPSNVVSDTFQSNRGDATPLPPVAVVSHLFPSVYEDECLSSVPFSMAMNPSSLSFSILSHRDWMRSYTPTSMNPALSADGSGTYTGSILVNCELKTPELDFQADSNGVFHSTYSESQNMVNGHVGTTPLPSDTSSLENSTFRVGKISMDQRKEKIHRYMKKRNERNFSKKIKYACSKTLADSRPRVRGRFAKNDELGEDFRRRACGNHDEEDKDKAVENVKEDEIIDSRLGGFNSFNCSYPIHSWI